MKTTKNKRAVKKSFKKWLASYIVRLNDYLNRIERGYYYA